MSRDLQALPPCRRWAWFSRGYTVPIHKPECLIHKLEAQARGSLLSLALSGLCRRKDRSARGSPNSSLREPFGDATSFLCFLGVSTLRRPHRLTDATKTGLPDRPSLPQSESGRPGRSRRCLLPGEDNPCR